MKNEVAHRITALLDAIRADFPRRKKAAEQLMGRLGIESCVELKIAPPVPVGELPTFDQGSRRRVTPMLEARFRHSGRWELGQDVWLDPAEMKAQMRTRSVARYHKALRENWQASAPMAFRDSGLTLFGVTEDVPQNLTYLVWRADGVEPEVWSYVGFDSRKFRDLEGYLKWCLERT